MDPLNVIVTAVVAGAALGLKSTTEQALQDAYVGLKTLILDRYGDRADVASALESVEQKPESEGRQSVLEEELEQTAVAEDQEVLGAAQALLEKAHLRQAEAGPSQVTASDRSVVVVGGAEGNVITIHGDGNVVGDGSESDVRKS